MRIKLNVWQRIGIVLSLIWFISFAEYFLHYGSQDAIRYYREARRSCDSVIKSSNDVAVSLEQKEDRVTQLAENRAKYRKCRRDARNMRGQMLSDVYKGVPLLIAADFGIIVFGWLLGWFGIVITRWIRRRFA